MLMTPSLTSNLNFAGLGQEGVRHDLNRLYYTDLSRQGMIDPAYGSPYYQSYYPYASNAYYPSAPQFGTFQGYDPRYSYARPYGYGQGYEYGRPYGYGQGYEYSRPYGFGQGFEYGRPYGFGQGFEYGRPYDYTRSYEFARPYDYARYYDAAASYGFARPYEYARPYEFAASFGFARPYEYARPQEFGYGRPVDASLPYFRSAEGMMRPTETLPTMGTEPFTVPSVNSAETPDAYLLVVELPGVDLKDVNLQIHGSSLVLNAFRRPTWSNGTVTVNYTFAEGRFGTLRRVLPLPAGVLPGQIQANFVNGLLTIVLPKTVNGASSIPQASIVINSNVPTTM